MRMGMLAEALAARGHEVTWFTSTFTHLDRREFYTTDQVLPVRPGYCLRLIAAGGYRRNLSWARFRYFRTYARRLADTLATQPSPDLVVSGYPQIGAAAIAVDAAKRHRIPIVVDVRDFWPDSLVELLPRPLRAVGRVALARDFSRSRLVFAEATALSAMSDGVLDWAMRAAGRARTPWDRVFPIGFSAAAAGGEASAVARRLAEQVAGRTVVAYVGTFGHSYDLTTVVDAALAVCRERERVSFLFLGAGPTLARCAARAKGHEHLHFPGWMSSADLRFLAERSHIGVLPWRGPSGAMPNKFFDYLSASMAVVSSAAGELNDLIESKEIGRTYAASDRAGLETSLAALLADAAALARCRAHAGQLFSERFLQEKVYADFAAHLEQIGRKQH